MKSAISSLSRKLQGRTIQERLVLLSDPALIITLAIALILLLTLEFRWPYYFLQDDGLDQLLPYYVHNWRSLVAGKIPLYDFHILAGVPHLAVGQSGAFYVPQYIAMFLSKAIWGHPFATIDLMGFMHGLIAVAGGYVLLRYLGATEAAASFGALAARFIQIFGRLADLVRCPFDAVIEENFRHEKIESAVDLHFHPDVGEGGNFSISSVVKRDFNG